MSQYVVKRGDTLSALAYKLLGPGYTYYDLMDFNPQINDPDFIEVGDIIEYPGDDMVIPGDVYIDQPAVAIPNSFYYIAGIIILTSTYFYLSKNKSKERSL